MYPIISYYQINQMKMATGTKVQNSKECLQITMKQKHVWIKMIDRTLDSICILSKLMLIQKDYKYLRVRNNQQLFISQTMSINKYQLNL